MDNDIGVLVFFSLVLEYKKNENEKEGVVDGLVSCRLINKGNLSGWFLFSRDYLFQRNHKSIIYNKYNILYIGVSKN